MQLKKKKNLKKIRIFHSRSSTQTCNKNLLQVVNPATSHLCSALEVEREDELSAPRLTLSYQEDSVAARAGMEHQLGSLGACQCAVEPRVLSQQQGDIGVSTHRPLSDCGDKKSRYWSVEVENVNFSEYKQKYKYCTLTKSHSLISWTD